MHQSVPFIDPAAALTFFHAASHQGLILNHRRLDLGWGKMLANLARTRLGIHSGSTRNVYVGNFEGFETFSEDKLRRDFWEYGDIKFVNFLKEKSCGLSTFPTLTMSSGPSRVSNKPDYSNLRIAHGTCCCANPPRSGPQGGGAMRRTASGNNPVCSDYQELFRVPVDGTGAGIKIDHVGEVGSELVETPTEA